MANTRAAGHGPAVHTIRPGSPVKGLVHANGVDTRAFTAEEMTRTMRETAGGERKITVLSAHR